MQVPTVGRTSLRELSPPHIVKQVLAVFHWYLSTLNPFDIFPFQGTIKNSLRGDITGKKDWTFNPSYFAVVFQSQIITTMMNMLNMNSSLVIRRPSIASRGEKAAETVTSSEEITLSRRFPVFLCFSMTVDSSVNLFICRLAILGSVHNLAAQRLSGYRSPDTGSDRVQTKAAQHLSRLNEI